VAFDVRLELGHFVGRRWQACAFLAWARPCRRGYERCPRGVAPQPSSDSGPGLLFAHQTTEVVAFGRGSVLLLLGLAVIDRRDRLSPGGQLGPGGCGEPACHPHHREGVPGRLVEPPLVLSGVRSQACSPGRRS
jgi:hypothetical protein